MFNIDVYHKFNIYRLKIFLIAIIPTIIYTIYLQVNINIEANEKTKIYLNNPENLCCIMNKPTIENLGKPDMNKCIDFKNKEWVIYKERKNIIYNQKENWIVHLVDCKIIN